MSVHSSLVEYQNGLVQFFSEPGPSARAAFGKRKALFLDRDGVVNVERGHILDPRQITIRNDCVDLILQANRHSWLVLVFTNQSAIGRGLLKLKNYELISETIRGQIEKRGGKIDAIYTSPFHESQGQGRYRTASSWTKPSPGMLLQASQDFGVRLEDSIAVGDQCRDIQAAQRAGIKQVFLLGVCSCEQDAEHQGLSVGTLDEILLTA